MGKCTWFEDNWTEEDGSSKDPYHSHTCAYDDYCEDDSNRCLFHENKNDYDEEKTQGFIDQLDEIVEKDVTWIDEYDKKSYLDFFGFVFPNKFYFIVIYLPRPSTPLCLVDANLRGANLRDAPLQGANLTHANLQGANLEDTQLQGVNLEYANLQWTSLRYARLQGANLVGTQLQWASCSEARLQGAKLDHAQLRGVNLDYAQLQGTDLRRTQLQGANLFGAQLQGADLKDAVFSSDPTFRPNPEWEKWVDEDLGNKMKGGLAAADVSNANLGADDDHEPAKFINTDLRGVNLSGADIAGTDFTGARLDGAVFRGAKFGVEEDNDKWDCQWSRKKTKKKKPVKLPIFTGANVEAADWADNREAQKDFVYAEYIRQFKEKHKGIAWLWRVTCNYGRSLLRWVIWSLGLAAGFGAVYHWLLGPDNFVVAAGTKLSPMLRSFYYSIVTFTTLGFGDVIPKTDVAAIWVALEVALGYVMLGGLISIFAVKVARRD